jgi:hypothetical protein
MYPIKVLFPKDKRPDVSLLPPVTTFFSTKTRQELHPRHPVSVSTSPVVVCKALFSNYSYEFRAQGWFNRAKHVGLHFAQHSAPSQISGWLAIRKRSVGDETVLGEICNEATSKKQRAIGDTSYIEK